jgi:hypothetical protein
MLEYWKIWVSYWDGEDGMRPVFYAYSDRGFGKHTSSGRWLGPYKIRLTMARGLACARDEARDLAHAKRQAILMARKEIEEESRP